MPRPPLTASDRVATSILAVPLSAVAFALLSPLLVLGADVLQGRALRRDALALWNPSLLLFIGGFDALIVGVLGVPVLAALNRRLGERWSVATLAGWIVMAMLVGLYVAIVPEVTWSSEMLAFWAVTGWVSATLFWAIRGALRRSWVTLSAQPNRD